MHNAHNEHHNQKIGNLGLFSGSVAPVSINGGSHQLKDMDHRNMCPTYSKCLVQMKTAILPVKCYVFSFFASLLISCFFVLLFL